MAKDKRSIGKILSRPKEIRTYLGNPSLVLSDCFIGIEVELEGLPTGEILAEESYWDIKADNSLRNYGGASGEFVLKFPLCGEDLIRALKEFSEVIGEFSSPPVTSERTSVHVHLDVRDLSPDQLYSLVVLYCVFERVLFSYCGKERETNNFCLPFYLAEGMVFEQLADVQNSAGLLAFTDRMSDNYRYSALNLCALRKFGSIEFRQCAGTYDAARILEWANIIMCLKKYIMENNISFDTFPAHISDVRYVGIVAEVFGKYAEKLLYHGIENDILLGIRQAQKLIFSSNKMQVLDALKAVIRPSNSSPPTESLIDKYTQTKWGRKYKPDLIKKEAPSKQSPFSGEVSMEWGTTTTASEEDVMTAIERVTRNFQIRQMGQAFTTTENVVMPNRTRNNPPGDSN